MKALKAWIKECTVRHHINKEQFIMWQGHSNPRAEEYQLRCFIAYSEDIIQMQNKIEILEMRETNVLRELF